MKTLSMIALKHTYQQTAQEYVNSKKAGLYSLADDLLDTMCTIEDVWTAKGYNLNDLTNEDVYTHICDEWNSLPLSTYNDLMNHLKGEY